jgi:hypothetical protein
VFREVSRFWRSFRSLRFIDGGLQWLGRILLSHTRCINSFACLWEGS